MDDWRDYQRMVLWDLKRLSEEVTRLNDKIDHMQIDLASLKVKASIWGVAGGLFSISLMLVVEFFIKR